MCLTYPGQVVALEGSDAVVRVDGRVRRASTLAASDTAVGDWVIVAAGSVIRRLDEADAMELQRLLRIANGTEREWPG
jgi:hydrogenase assembly chaperone HypC/HupF